jgi:hypothetical protein
MVPPEAKLPICPSASGGRLLDRPPNKQYIPTLGAQNSANDSLCNQVTRVEMGNFGQQSIFPVLEEPLEGIGMQVDSSAFIRWREVVWFEDVGIDQVCHQGVVD